MDQGPTKTTDEEEQLFVGYLTLGDQKKDGSVISFKDKGRRYFVLRCLARKLLTLSGYKTEKEYKSPSGNHHKNVEQIVMSKYTKVHSLHLPSRSKKAKDSDVLCIVQDKNTIFLEANSRKDLDDWCEAFHSIFLRLGWKEGHPVPSPPHSTPSTELQTTRPGSFPRYLPTPNGQSQDRRKVNSIDSQFDSSQHGASHCSPPPLPCDLGSSSQDNGTLGQQLCCPRSHMSLSGTEDPVRYVNVHNVSDPTACLQDAQSHHERLINVRDIYANMTPDTQIAHPLPPPALPPRPKERKRGGTFPGVLMAFTNPESTPNESVDPKHRQRPSSITGVPGIRLSETPASPLSKQFPHVFDIDARRKISLPQPLGLHDQHLCPPMLPHAIGVSPPESPVMLRKSGSYSNLTVNLSSRPLPSPVQGDSFDVHTLRWEMSHTDGFAVALQKSEAQEALGLVRIADYVWIAGWKTGKSEISQKLHVGDQLRQINEQIIVDPAVANGLFTTSAVDKIWLVIRRLPHAKVRNLHRSSKSESWGFEVEGNRVIQVSTSGPAADAKMTPRADGAFSERLCDWIITEIDGEPVCLLSKRDEVKDRMANAGLTMALVIQPDDFIKRLNAELQKVKFAHEYFVGSENQDML